MSTSLRPANTICHMLSLLDVITQVLQQQSSLQYQVACPITSQSQNEHFFSSSFKHDRVRFVKRLFHGTVIACQMSSLFTLEFVSERKMLIRPGHGYLAKIAVPYIFPVCNL